MEKIGTATMSANNKSDKFTVSKREFLKEINSIRTIYKHSKIIYHLNGSIDVTCKDAINYSDFNANWS